uniref:Uncharacterized protein n=1 Tax=Ciona savignyi TaxID=51511 RepID=H2YHR0_CIOSA
MMLSAKRYSCATSVATMQIFATTLQRSHLNQSNQPKKRPPHHQQPLFRKLPTNHSNHPIYPMTPVLQYNNASNAFCAYLKGMQNHLVYVYACIKQIIYIIIL